MKIKLLTDEAAAKFSKSVGEFVDLQTPDALALIDDKGGEPAASEASLVDDAEVQPRTEPKPRPVKSKGKDS